LVFYRILTPEITLEFLFIRFHSVSMNSKI
jgi:hypothetical protein